MTDKNKDDAYDPEKIKAQLEKRKLLLKEEILRLRAGVNKTLSTYHTFRKQEQDPRNMDSEFYDILDDLGFCYETLCDDLCSLIGYKTYKQFYDYPTSIEQAYDLCKHNWPIDPND